MIYLAPVLFLSCYSEDLHEKEGLAPNASCLGHSSMNSQLVHAKQRALHKGALRHLAQNSVEVRNLVHIANLMKISYFCQTVFSRLGLSYSKVDLAQDMLEESDLYEPDSHKFAY